MDDFLMNASSLLKNSGSNNVDDILRSHYLMRWRQLCPKLESLGNISKTRCPHCYLEWRRDTKCRIKSIKLTKKQKQRIKLCKNPNVKSHLNSNQLERICSFCKHVSSIPIQKINMKVSENVERPFKTQLKDQTKTKRNNEVEKGAKAINIYSKTSEIFSLKNEKNKLQSTKPVEAAPIKNKKKKVKFAGLCQRAVLASAKMKADKDKNNKLNLFLKPSD